LVDHPLCFSAVSQRLAFAPVKTTLFTGAPYKKAYVTLAAALTHSAVAQATILISTRVSEPFESDKNGAPR